MIYHVEPGAQGLVPTFAVFADNEQVAESEVEDSGDQPASI